MCGFRYCMFFFCIRVGEISVFYCCYQHDLFIHAELSTIILIMQDVPNRPAISHFKYLTFRNSSCSAGC